jgi:hypothetical protein
VAGAVAGNHRRVEPHQGDRQAGSACLKTAHVLRLVLRRSTRSPKVVAAALTCCFHSARHTAAHAQAAAVRVVEAANGRKGASRRAVHGGDARTQTAGIPVGCSASTPSLSRHRGVSLSVRPQRLSTGVRCTCVRRSAECGHRARPGYALPDPTAKLSF